MMAYFRRPVDLASLVFFRIMAGTLLSIELLYSLSLGDLWEYSHPGYHFHYQWFSWVKPLGEQGMTAIYAATICAGFFVAAGFFYRFMSVILFLGYLSLLLMEATQYVNHLYLYVLISFWLMLLPLHRNGSLDARFFPEHRSNHLPLWVLHLFQFQLAVVYFYAGIAKLHPDWLSGRMMNLFLTARGIHHEELPVIMAWGGLCFDLCIVPLLMWRKTRIPAFVCAIAFHLTNVVMFGLGSFPWFALLSCTLFMKPEWPRRIPVLKDIFAGGNYASVTSRITPVFLCLYVGLQVFIPLRHHLYPHDAGWSEEGHNYSWRMKTRIKRGIVSFSVVNLDSGYMWKIDPSLYMTETQLKDLGGNPEFILQFAHFLRDRFRKKGMVVAVYANARASLNAYPYETLIDSSRDLAQEESGILPYKWIRKRVFSSEYTADAGYRAFRSGHKAFLRNARSGGVPGARAQHP
jgi:hypothetical protein